MTGILILMSGFQPFSEMDTERSRQPDFMMTKVDTLSDSVLMSKVNGLAKLRVIRRNFLAKRVASPVQRRQAITTGH